MKLERRADGSETAAAAPAPDRSFVLWGAGFGLAGVVAGAFGAHGLKGHIDADLYDAFQAGARFEMYHAAALIGVAWAWTRWPGPWIRRAGWLFVAGVPLFSGSLYLLAVTGVRALGAITPLGGLAFIAGWAALAYGVWKPDPQQG